MSDLISRQAAIDALGERPMVWSNEDEYALGERSQYDIDRLAIETVPSVQPEPCDDAVSRKAVLDMLHQECSSMVENFLKEKINALLSVTPKQRWTPVTLETLPNPNSVVVVCGKKGTWDYGTYRGWHGDIHSWWWKKNTIKHVYWWMYKDDAMSPPYREEGERE